MTDLLAIGRCIGCEVLAHLDLGVCAACLGNPRRGRRWAEFAHRVRRDPQFALAFYERIGSAEDRALFMSIFGVAIRAARRSAPE